MPIRLWLSSSRQYREGEKARIQVETNDDGYLLVFNYDTDGRLRVIFPIDPRDDNFVRGGRRYEIRGRGDRESFIVGAAGDGMVYAAVSADPFRVEALEAGGNWDYARVAIDRESADPEADITDLLQDVATSRGFDYDVLTYQVYGERSRYVTTAWYPRSYGYYDDYYYCDPFYRPSLFGCRYSPGGWYGGFYSGYGYGYGYGSYYPWYRNRYVYYGGNGRSRNYPIVTGRPRGYTIVRRGSGGSGNRAGSVGRPGTGSFGGALPGGSGSRPRAERPRDAGGRPGNDRVNQPTRGSRGEAPGVSRPRGRRATPPEARDSRPTIERERPGERGSVDFGNRRPSVVPDAPRRVEVPARRAGGERSAEPRSVSRPRAEPSRPRSEPRERASTPRSEPRERASSPRSEPRERASSPRSEPSRRASPPPRSEPSRPSARASEPRRESPKSSGSGSSRSRPRGNGNR